MPSVRYDPEGRELSALFGVFDDFKGKSVLEIGCGGGRLTWRYADRAARVTAIDPYASSISRAKQTRPPGFEHVQLVNEALEDFVGRTTEKFDIAILAWSL